MKSLLRRAVARNALGTSSALLRESYHSDSICCGLLLSVYSFLIQYSLFILYIGKHRAAVSDCLKVLELDSIKYVLESYHHHLLRYSNPRPNLCSSINVFTEACEEELSKSRRLLKEAVWKDPLIPVLITDELLFPHSEEKSLTFQGPDLPVHAYMSA